VTLGYWEEEEEAHRQVPRAADACPFLQRITSLRIITWRGDGMFAGTSGKLDVAGVSGTTSQ